jgi:AcrR family transcriptional regulator
MPRPVNANAEQTQRDILAAARRLFAEHGKGGVSIRTIAGQAGVTLSTVHHYFGRKQDLYRACLDAFYEDGNALRLKLQPLVMDTVNGGVAPAVEALVRTIFQFARANQPSLRLLMRQVIAGGGLEPDIRDRYQIPFLEITEQILGTVLDLEPVQLRLTVQSVMNLIVRYSLSSDAELQLFVRSDGADAARAIEDHLVAVSFALLGLDRAATSA